MKQQSRSILLSILLTLALVIGLVPGMGLTAYADEHIHDFEYSASGDTITATCKNEGCDLNDNKVTLKIVPNSVLYYDDGLSKEASLEGLEAFNAATGKNITTDNISYYKGDTNVTAQIKAGTGTSLKGATYTARLDVEGKRATVTFKLTAKPAPHTHIFSYTADGNVITATCTQSAANMEACDLTNKQAALTLNAPLCTTYDDGKSVVATITGQIPGVTNPTINYRRSDTPLSAAPEDAGTYTAWCQLGNVTARVTYTIDKKTNPGFTISPATKTDLVYSGQPQALITAGAAVSGSILYTAGIDPDSEPDVTAGGMPYTGAVPEMTNAGTYYVWYKIEGGRNYTSTAPQKLTVTIGQATPTILSAPMASAISYGQSLEDSIIAGGEPSVDGTFAWKDGTIKPEVPDSQKTEYNVIFTPSDTGNYKTVELKLKVTVTKADPTPATVTAINRTFDQTTQALVNVTGAAVGGTMQYALGADAQNAPTSGWTEDPTTLTATDAGTYYVWYKVVGDANHNDTQAACVTVTIGFPVTFDPNGGTGGPEQTKTEGGVVTIASEIPTRYNNGAYVVTFDPNGGTMTGKVTYAQHRTYFRFVCWNTARDGSGTSYFPGDPYTKKEPVTLYAQWVKNGEATASIPLPTPKLEGHVFQGWATNTDLESGMTGRYKPTADITLYATWTIGTYTISFDTDGGTEIAPITGEYGTGITTVPENPTKPGYVFKAWDKAIPETMPGENLVIKAIYEVQPFGEAEFALTEYLSEIEEEAFEGAAMKSVYVPDTCTAIGADAFKGCAQLEKLRLPKDCAIDETAFTGCKALAIYAPAGGTVEEFCETQGISFVPETAE